LGFGEAEGRDALLGSDGGVKGVWLIADDDGICYGVFSSENQAEWSHDHLPHDLHERTRIEFWVLNEVYNA
jgi:hypothetical protein